MCLIFVALKSHPDHKLIIAANRDEYYDRPTAKASFWDESPGLLAGKDLRGGGTWLGITRSGRIAAITNYRDPSSIKSHAPSRGKLVVDFLLGRQNAVDYLERLDQKAAGYNGFNLLIGNKEELYFYSNRGDVARNLFSGVYGLSNHLLDTPWPKVTRAKKMFRKSLSEKTGPQPHAIFEILSDRSIPDDEDLPDTGVDLEWERILSPIFITSPAYGTRSSTLLLIDQNDHVTFIEKTFDPAGQDNPTTIRHEFQIDIES